MPVFVQLNKLSGAVPFSGNFSVRVSVDDGYKNDGATFEHRLSLSVPVDIVK